MFWILLNHQANIQLLIKERVKIYNSNIDAITTFVDSIEQKILCQVVSKMLKFAAPLKSTGTRCSMDRSLVHKNKPR